jgi:acetoacetate decarboxylase
MMATTIPAADVVARAFAMPLANPAYPPLPDRFLDRVSLTVTYRSDFDKVAALVPEPLTVTDPTVSIAFLFMRAPKLGDYYEVAQSISTELNGEPLLFWPAMYAGSVAAVLQGREWWGLPKKFGAPMVGLRNDTLVGTLKYSGALVARATMGYGHQTMEPDDAERAAGSPGVVLKIIPHLVRFGYGDVVVKEAYTGPGTLDLYPARAGALGGASGAGDRVCDTHGVRYDPPSGRSGARLPGVGPPADLEATSLTNP